MPFDHNFEVTVSGPKSTVTHYIGRSAARAEHFYEAARKNVTPFATVFLVKDDRPILITRWDHLGGETVTIVPPAAPEATSHAP